MKPIPRRRLLLAALTLPLSVGSQTASGDQAVGPSIEKLKAGYATRLRRLLAQGHLPYIDIESSCDPNHLDMAVLARQLDDLHIGLMAMSCDPVHSAFSGSSEREQMSLKLVANYPDRFIPVGDGGQPPHTTRDLNNFIESQKLLAERGDILLFGEYEFRHYPSPRQVKRGQSDRDVNIPIDGPLGHRLFAMSERLQLAVQIHYEIEDDLLPALESMLTQYPQAKVIWCHLAQVRYRERAEHYSARYVAELIERFPNLYFDTAFGDAHSIYPLSQQRHSRIWDASGTLDGAWKELIVSYPDKFLSALDLGADRMWQIAEYDRKHREFLGQLPHDIRHQVAYRNAWRLLFSENFS